MSGRIVVKIGSQVLCGERGELNLDVLEQLVGQIAGLAGAGELVERLPRTARMSRFISS